MISPGEVGGAGHGGGGVLVAWCRYHRQIHTHTPTETHAHVLTRFLCEPFLRNNFVPTSSKSDGNGEGALLPP